MSAGDPNVFQDPHGDDEFSKRFGDEVTAQQPVRTPSKTPNTSRAVGIAIFVIIAAISGILRFNRRQQQNQRPFPGQFGQRPNSRMSARAQQLAKRVENANLPYPLTDLAAEEEALQIMITQLTEDLNDKDLQKSSGHFDQARCVLEVEKFGKGLGLELERHNLYDAVGSFAPSLNESSLGVTFKYSIRRIEFDAKKGEAVATTYAVTEKGDMYKVARWWLRKSVNRWRVYDYEHWFTGMRYSASVAQNFQFLRQRPGEFADYIELQEELQTNLIENDLESVSKSVTRLEKFGVTTLRAESRAMYWLAKGIVHEINEQWQEALADFDKAESLNRGSVATYAPRARVLAGLGRHQESLKQAERLIARVGDNPDANMLCGDALSNLNRPAEAMARFSKALDDFPLEFDAYYNLALSASKTDLPNEEKFKKIRDKLRPFLNSPDELMFILDALLEDAPEAAELVTTAYRELQPADALGDYYVANLANRRGAYDEAATLLGSALKRPAKGDLRKRCSMLFVEVMFNKREYSRAYSSSIDKKGAIERMIPLLIRNELYDQLDEVGQKHRLSFPKDPNGFVSAAEVAAYKEDWEGMIGFLRQAIANSSDGDKKNTWQRRIVQTLVRQDKTMAGYQEMQSSNDAFLLFAQELEFEPGPQRLETLIAAHAKKSPNDPELAYFRARLALKEKQFRQAADLLKPILKAGDGRPATHQRTYVSAAYQAGDGLQAYQNAPNRIRAFNQLASLLNTKKDVQLLRVLAVLHNKNEPKDPWGYYYMARCEEVAKKWKEAGKWYKRGQEFATGYQTNTFRSSYLRMLSEAGQVLEQYKLENDPADFFSRMARTLHLNKKHTLLVELIDAHRVRLPDDPNLAYYQASLHLDKKDYAKAAGIVNQALAKKHRASSERTLRNLFYRIHMEAGTVLEGYQQATDKNEAFARMASSLLYNKQLDQLVRLIAEHKQFADRIKPNVLSVEAQLAVIRKQYDQAIQLLSRIPDGDEWRGYMWRRVAAEAHYGAGKIQESVSVSKDPVSMFRVMAGLMQTKKDHAGIAKLIAAYKDSEVSPDELLVWQAEASWLKKDYQHIIEILGKRSKPWRRSTKWRANRRLLYALVITQQYDEVRKYLKKVTGSYSGYDRITEHNWYEALIAADQDKVDETLTHLKRWAEDYYDYEASELYDDEILGPKMRTNAFAKVRKKFPPEDKDGQ